LVHGQVRYTMVRELRGSTEFCAPAAAHVLGPDGSHRILWMRLTHAAPHCARGFESVCQFWSAHGQRIVIRGWISLVRRCEKIRTLRETPQIEGHCEVRVKSLDVCDRTPGRFV
jgi:hypothetical protein